MPTSSTDRKTQECKTCACPSCGGLECLCRPRFFAGQLLTDEALNNLEHYIVEKNKLHNRYLHGWGVVCGLEAVCHPCNGVTVRAGYALSPCGDDIVVCKDVSVDVCSLIAQCCDKQREWECEPFASGHDMDCSEMDGEWILTVRYDEKTSRGITALKGITSSCCSSCSCGGSSGCGCGCHGHNGNGGSQHKQYATASAGAQTHGFRSAQTTVAAQCEPTLTCEGFVFEVCKPAPEKGDERRPVGALIERAQRCMATLFDSLPKKPTQNLTKAALFEWCSSLKQRLRENLFDHPVYNCRLADAFNFTCPDPNDPKQTLQQYDAAVSDVVENVTSLVAAEYIQYCICSSFLPPCPELVCDPRVPLATVTVRKDANGICRVVRVCNLGKRRFLITFPILGYWFSFAVAPLRQLFRKVLERICCVPFVDPRRGLRSDQNPILSSRASLSESREKVFAATAPTQDRGFKAFAGQVWENRTRNVDERTLFLGAIGARDERGNPYLSETELKNPFYTLMVNRMVGPLLAKLPDHTLDSVKASSAIFSAGTFSTKAQGRTAAAVTADVVAEAAGINELKTRVADLQATVERQSSMIDELQKLVKKQK